MTRNTVRCSWNWKKWVVAVSCQAMMLSGVAGTAKVTVEVKDGFRYFTSDAIPDHTTGKFPNAGNPNSISPQQHRFKVPVSPERSDSTTPLILGPFGIAVNGVMFDPGANEWWNGDRNSGWQYDAMSGAVRLGLDENHAHVQPTGNYHYHGIPTGLVKAKKQGDAPLLLGYAADGYPIYDNTGYADGGNASSGTKKLRSGYRLKSGTRAGGPGGKHDGSFVQDYEWVAGLGDMDECNGRTGVTADYPQGTYYYVLTDEFPYVPRMFRGKPDESFLRKGPPMSRRGPRGREAGNRGGERPQSAKQGEGGPGRREGNEMERGPHGHRPPGHDNMANDHTPPPPPPPPPWERGFRGEVYEGLEYANAGGPARPQYRYPRGAGGSELNESHGRGFTRPFPPPHHHADGEHQEHEHERRRPADECPRN